MVEGGASRRVSRMVLIVFIIFSVILLLALPVIGAKTASQVLSGVDSKIASYGRGKVLKYGSDKLNDAVNKYQNEMSPDEFQKLVDGVEERFPELSKDLAPYKKTPEAPANSQEAPPPSTESPSQKPDSSKPSDQKPATPQNSEPIKPQDVMDSAQKDCKLDSENDKSPDPNSDPCSKEKKCGYDSCSFFYKSKGEKDCKQFVQSKKEYDAAKKAYEATPPTPPGPKVQKKQDMETKRKKADGDGSKCCASRKAAEGLQRLIQGNPCAGMLKGNPLTGGSLDACKPWILSSNCPVQDPKQLHQLYNDRGFMKSLTAKDLPTIKNTMAQGLTDYGDLQNMLSESAINSLDPSRAAKVAVDGAPADPSAVKLDSKDGTVTTGNNQYKASELDNARLNRADQSVTKSAPEGQVKVDARPSGPAKPVSFSGADPTATISDYGRVTAHLLGYGQIYDGAMAAGVKVTGLYQRWGPVIGSYLTGDVVYEPTQMPISVTFLPDPPPVPGLLGVNVGRVPPDWIHVIPRANSRIDFDGPSGIALTSVVQNMGVPRGSSEMALGSRLGGSTVKRYDIDGLKDYDFMAYGGLVVWDGPMIDEVRVIASSFGIPPDQYLSKQQKGMVYG